MTKNKPSATWSILFCLLLVGVTSISAQKTDFALTELRNQFALNYMQPEAHFALAKYFLDKGDKVQAFFIIENARRTRFSEADFDASYTAFFGDPMPEPPSDAKQAFETGFKLVEQKNYTEAEPHLIRAARLGRSFYINAWVGRFYYKALNNSAKALPYYFDAYFLYPHAYETEFVESRIRKIVWEDADTLYKMLRNGGRSPAELARDRNPVVVGMALTEIAGNWRPEHLKAVVECLANDDGGNRWQAFLIIQKHAGASFAEIVTTLLEDKDLRKRGLVLYAVIELWKDKGYEILAKMLKEPAELLRFDALSALAIGGGPKGKTMLREHQRVETDKRLKLLIGQALKQKTAAPK